MSKFEQNEINKAEQLYEEMEAKVTGMVRDSGLRTKKEKKQEAPAISAVNIILLHSTEQRKFLSLTPRV